MRTVKMLTRAHGMGLGSWEISLRSDISAGAPNSGRQPCKGPGKSSRQREEPVQGSLRANELAVNSGATVAGGA